MSAKEVALSTECLAAQESFRACLEGNLAPAAGATLEKHLLSCEGCRKEFAKQKQVFSLLGKAYSRKKISDGFDNSANSRLNAMRQAPAAAKTGFISSSVVMAPVGGKGADGEGELEPAESPVSTLDRLGAAPWWAVSVALHVLVIILLGLITMSIGALKNDSSIIVLTRLEKMAEQKQEEEKKPKADMRDVLEKKETPATDPNSQVASNIVVPPDILAKAELGDHFETINLDRPDTQSAFGNPEARMFHSVSGNDEPEGGGGLGGSSLMDDLIGAGGASSPGSGGGWGGGDGTGTGIGKGAGHGSFGQRSGGGRRLMVMKHGGSKATESSVDKALDWLARHQEKEGNWKTDKYLDNKAVRYGGALEYFVKYDTGITGLAALAFLGAGHTMRVGKYKNHVKSAIEWLLSQQGADGDFTSKVKPCHDSVTFYCHCIATLACAEALGMGGEGAENTYLQAQNKNNLRDGVNKAVELILKWQSQNSTGAWTYYSPYNVCDVTVSGWAIMALKSAKIAGIKVPIESFKKASEAVAKCTVIDKTKGDYGMAHTGYLAANSHQFNSKGYAITAAAMVIQEFTGADREQAGINAAGGTVTQPDALPNWIMQPADVNTDHQNLYYWYYGSLGCFQAGGEAWKLWNEALKKALVPHQVVGGDNDGSWPPDDVWGAWGGRVYSTALGALCLEVYYRYLPLYK